MTKDNQVWRNTLSQIFARILIVGISLFTIGFLTRSFGVVGFGDYVFISSVVLFFTSLSDLGANILGVREASLDKEKATEIFNGVLAFRLIVSFVLFFVFLLLVYSLPQFKDIKEPSLLAAFVIPFLILKTSGQSILQFKLRLDLSAILEIFSSLVFLILLLVLLFNKSYFSLSSVLFFWSLSALFSSVFGYFLFRKFIRLKITFDRNKLKKIFWQALPLGTYFLVYSFYDRGIDNFFLKTFFNSEAVAYYGLSYKIHGNLVLGAAFLMNSLFPIFSSLSENKEKFLKYFKKSFTFLLTLGILVCFFFFKTSSLVIEIVAGKDYMLSATILRILLFATLAAYINHLTGYLMVCLREQKALLKFSLIALFVNLIMNYLLIPYFSYWAASVITVFTELTVLVLTLVFLRKKYQLKVSLGDYCLNLKLLFKERQKFFN